MKGREHRFDLVVIGAGPAGVAGAIAAGIFGRKVALVERAREMGGALVNTGTLPSKTLRETALALTGFRSRELYGVDLSMRGSMRVADFLRHERTVKKVARENLAGRLEKLAVSRFTGSARFVDPHVVEVTPTRGGRSSAPPRLRGDFVLIAPGSAPVQPPEFPFEHPRVWDSDQILELEHLPRRLAVVGAGVIGSEYASTFTALGSKVHVIDGRDVLLPFLDRELSKRLADAMARLGIVFHWKERVQSCQAGRGPVRLVLTSGAKLTVDAVLVAAGRRACVEDLGLDAAGLAVNERGLIEVDAQFRTRIPHILAAGDVVGFPSLASASAEQARVAVSTAFDLDVKESIASLMPNGIYTIPEASTVGATEESLREGRVDYVVGRAIYSDNARGEIIGDRSGFLKLLFRREDMKLLGVHVMGEHATELVHIGLMTMLCDGGARSFHEACFNVPTLSQLYKDAAYRAQLARDLPAVARRVVRRVD